MITCFDHWSLEESTFQIYAQSVILHTLPLNYVIKIVNILGAGSKWERYV